MSMPPLSTATAEHPRPAALSCQLFHVAMCANNFRFMFRMASSLRMSPKITQLVTEYEHVISPFYWESAYYK